LIQAPCPLTAAALRAAVPPSAPQKQALQESQSRRDATTVSRRRPPRQRACPERLRLTLITGLSPPPTSREECGASAAPPLQTNPVARGAASVRKRGACPCDLVQASPHSIRDCASGTALSTAPTWVNFFAHSSVDKLGTPRLYTPHNGAPPRFSARWRACEAPH
jgi:hypothetical protein